MATSVIFDLVFIFAAALAGGLIADRLRQSPIVGYVLGGILVGPYVLGLVNDFELVQGFADIGVTLLMFTLGIEFSLSRLQRVKKVALLGGFIQILALILIGILVGIILDFSLYQGLFLGCVLSISSTIIVFRALADQGEADSIHGQIMLGILIVQDLAVILMVSLLPNLHEIAPGDFHTLLLPLGKAIVFVGLLIFLAQKIIPFILDYAAQGNNKDIFLIVALTMGLGIAVLSQAIGLSLTLGAFLAGLVISESEYAQEIMGKISSFRDAFVILFFVSVGMLVNPGALLDDWPSLLALLFITIFAKFLILFAITKLFKYHSRTAFYVGLGMIQTGEFSIVLAKLGIDKNLIPDSLYNLILANTIFTIILTPWFIKMAPYWYHYLREKRALRFLFPEPDFEESEVDVSNLEGHIILCGFGRVGRNIAIALQQLGQSFLVIDYDYPTIRNLSKHGIPYIYGDASNEMVQLHARPDRARMAIVALPDAFSNKQAIHNLLKFNPDLKILARAHNQREREILYRQGATEVIQPEIEASLQAIRHLILHLKLPAEVIDPYLENLYIKDLHDLMQKQLYPSMRQPSLKVREFNVEKQSPLTGKKLSQSQIRQSTGSTVVTIKKANGEVILNPSSEETIEVGDFIIAMGSFAQLSKLDQMNRAKLKDNKDN